MCVCVCVCVCVCLRLLYASYTARIRRASSDTALGRLLQVSLDEEVLKTFNRSRIDDDQQVSKPQTLNPKRFIDPELTPTSRRRQRLVSSH
jgi:hypothetical protein